jgi:hypothetical protein
MDNELQTYYENLLNLFSQEGWKQFIEDFQDSQEILGDITTISDEKQFWYRRGQIEMLGRVLSYEHAIKNSYEDFEKDVYDEAVF